MKLRIALSVMIAVMVSSLPVTASAWWWNNDRETLVDVAIDVNENIVPGAFDTLLALVVDQPKVFRRLDGWGKTTVFAPTDDAFQALFDYVEENLCLTPDQYPSWYVRDVLFYHLAWGTKDSTKVFGASKVRMMFGGFVFPDAGSLSLADNLTNSIGAPNAGIISPYFDVPADNGVIHVIDRVLIPYLPPSNC